VPGARHPGVDLGRGQLSALARLGPLGHLDLDVVRLREIEAGDAEPSARHLLDGRPALRIQQALDVLAALPGVGLRAQPVHRDRQRLVGLLRERAVAHGTGGEALDDLRDRLDLLEGDGAAGRRAQVEQPAEREQLLRLCIHPSGVVLEDVVPAGAGGVLQPEHRLRVEEVRRSLAAPGVLPAHLERPVRHRIGVRGVGGPVAGLHLGGDAVQTDPLQPGAGPGEELLHEARGQAERLEGLRGMVGVHRRDAHLGHDLEQALAQRPEHVAHRGVLVHARHPALAHHGRRRLHREIGIHRRGAEPDERGHVVDLPHVPGLHEEGDARAGPPADEVVVQRRGDEQGRDGGELRVGVAVGEHEEPRPRGDRLVRHRAEVVDAPPQARAAARTVAGAQDRRRRPPPAVRALLREVDERGEVLVVDDGVRQVHLEDVLRPVGQQVALAADAHAHGGDERLADRVQRRIGHLGEALGEVVEEQPGTLGERGDGRVGAHGAEGFGPCLRHRAHEDAQLLVRVAERALPALHRGPRVRDPLALGELAEVHRGRGDPLVVGRLRTQPRLDLRVRDDAAGTGVHEEHAAGAHAAARQHLLLRQVDDPGLAGEHHGVLREGVPRRPQAVAVQHGAHQLAVREGDAGGAVPGLHEEGVVAVEGPALLGDVRIRLPGLGDEHRHGVRQRAAGHHEQLEDLVQGAGIGQVRVDHREQAGEVRVGAVAVRGGQQLTGELGLACGHPVAVAPHRVDLAVVGEHAERLRKRPGREGVGGEAGVDDRDARGEAAVREVRVERLELARAHHALVDERAGGQRREVDPGVLGALAQREGPAVEGPGVRLARGGRGERPGRVRGEEDLREVRHRRPRGGAQHRGVDGHLPPPEHGERLLGGQPGDELAPGGGIVRVEEGGADGVLAGARQGEVRDGGEERVRDLHVDARAVAGALVAAHAAAVLHVPQGGERLGHHGVVRVSAVAGDEGQAAGVVLVGGISESVRRRPPGVGELGMRSCGGRSHGSTALPGRGTGPQPTALSVLRGAGPAAVTAVTLHS
jgi:hypothetical protein